MTVHYIGLAADPGPALDLKARAKAVARIAAAHAADVDVRARFPIEAIEAAKDLGLLGAMIPRAEGGEGASVTAVAEVCYTLGRACSSTAMIFAMHQVKVACLVRHGGEDAWIQEFLRRAAREQLLLASSTTEGQGGGDVRSSTAAVGRDQGRITLSRDARVMSYGEQADAVVTTARRDFEAAGADQVLVVFPKETYRLEQTLEWETLGMRGTCSAGFAMTAEGEDAMVLSQPYAEIHAQTMTPCAHLLWSSVWAGIAAAATERARLFLRKAARNSEGKLPPASAHYLKALTSLHALRALVASALARFEAAAGEDAESLELQTSITMLKVEVSELALATVLSAMRTCGLAGYRNDGDASIGRHLRDILSAPIMINNDRILGNLGPSALMSEIPETLAA